MNRAAVKNINKNTFWKIWWDEQKHPIIRLREKKSVTWSLKHLHFRRNSFHCTTLYYTNYSIEY